MAKRLATAKPSARVRIILAFLLVVSREVV
jgi:hypothetical protein